MEPPASEMTGAATAVQPVNLREQLLACVQSLSYLPTNAAVAMKFIELGKNPDVDPSEYCKVASADSSLSSKLLALANSSWAGVRSRVTNIRTAVNLLGLSNVRTLAISYCMTGLHNELHVSAAESQAFWESSLCKAVAARKFACLLNGNLADEAFAAGLFQDFALTVMYSLLRAPYLEVLQTPGNSVQQQLERERELFGMDHAELGRMVAQKLELPELFVDLIAYHHDPERLRELTGQPVLGAAAHAAALLPHMLNIWGADDATTLSKALEQRAPETSLMGFITDVQAEFTELFTYFCEKGAPDGQLAELLVRAARENADNATRLVGWASDLMNTAAETGVKFSHQVQSLEDKAHTDPLTRIFNRPGFSAKARDVISRLGRQSGGVAICYFDVDKFKSVNDRFGHAFGDLVLRTVAGEVAALAPRDACFGRWGGDEFVFLMTGPREGAVELMERIVARVGSVEIAGEKHATHVTLSAGLLYVDAAHVTQPLAALIRAADELMYAAKRRGGNVVEVRDW